MGLDDELFGNIARLTRWDKISFYWLCDFNALPDAVKGSDCLRRMKTVVLVPSNTDITCTSADGGSLIDYCIISEVLTPLAVGLWAEWQVPLKPHCGLEIEADMEAPDRLYRQICRPHPLPKIVAPDFPRGKKASTKDAEENEDDDEEEQAKYAMFLAQREIKDDDVIRKCSPEILCTAARLGTDRPWRHRCWPR